MQFKEGATVYTPDGEKIGNIDRIVIDPDTKEITHLVVEKGFIFTEDKVVPMSVIDTVSSDRVILREKSGDLERFPDFKESHYLSTDGGIPPTVERENRIYPIYYYPPLGSMWKGGPGLFATPMFVKKTEKNIPEGTVAIDEGTDAVSSDGEDIGEIERVFTDPESDRATHLLISEGLLFKEKKVIPTNWIKLMSEDKVHLSVNSDLLERLPEYQE